MFESNPLIFELLLWTGVIAMSPFLFQLSRVLTRYFITSRMQSTKIILTLDIGNKKEKEITIDTSSKTPIVKQIQLLSEGKSYE